MNKFRELKEPCKSAIADKKKNFSKDWRIK